MFNALIKEASLVISSQPFVSLNLLYNKEGQMIEYIASPLILANKIDSPNFGVSLAKLMEVIGVNRWEDVKDKIVRIDFNKEGQMSLLAHSIKDLSIQLASDNEEQTEVEEKVEE